MKRAIDGPAIVGLALVFAFVATGQVAEAQSGANVVNQPQGQQTERLNLNDVIELMQTDIGTHRKSIIAKSMELTEGESRAFWPLYKEYQAVLSQVNDRTIELIETFLRSYQNLSDEKAEVLLDEYLKIEKEKLRLKDKYVKKFRKKLTHRKVLKYFQLENKLDAALNLGFAEEIPLVK